MTTGTNHDKITCLAALGLGLATCTIDPTLSAEVALGTLIGGLIISPDIDLIQSRCTQRWGWLGFIWIPYQKVIPHRCFLSHCVVIGTLVRILYLVLPTIGVLALLGLPVGDWIRDWGAEQIDNLYYLYEGATVYGDSIPRTKTVLVGLVGLEAGAVCHLLADGTLFGRVPRAWKRVLKLLTKPRKFAR